MTAGRVLTRAVGVLAGALAGALACSAPAAAGPMAVQPVPRAAHGDSLPAATGLPVRVQVSSVTPTGVLRPDDRLVVRGRIVNADTRPLTDLVIGLRHRSARLSSRDDVSDWLDGTDQAAGNPVSRVFQALPRLDPGRGASFEFAVDPAVLGLRGTRFGPRGLAVQVLAGSDRDQVGLYRTAVVWMPAESFEPTPLALVAPLTASTPSTDAGAVDATLLGELQPEGRLSRLVAATAGQPVGWALDPALLAAARTGVRPAGGAPPTDGQTQPAGSASTAPSGTAGTASGTGEGGQADADGSGAGAAGAVTAEQVRPVADAWLRGLLSARDGKETWLLPFADPDVAALTHAGSAQLLRLAQSRARSAARDALGTAPAATLGWPAGGVADKGTLALLAATGHGSVLLDGAGVPPAEPNGNTLSAVSRLPGGKAGLRGLLYDRSLSAAFAASGGGDPSGSTQRLLADLAALTLERPYDPQPQVIAAPRGWDPKPAGVQAAMQALAAAPWVRLSTLATLASARPGEPRTLAGYPAQARAAELDTAQVRAVAQADARLNRFGSALVEPAAVIGPRNDRALSLTSSAWRTDRTGQATATAALVGDVAVLSDGPVVIEGGPFNLLTGSGRLPLRVSNPHPFAMRVELTLRPRSGRLVAEERTRLVLPPSGTRLVQVKVRSVADGTVAVDTLLSSPTGVLVSAPTTVVVRIHRDWETRGILVLAAGLSLVFLIGLVRSVRRGRVRVSPEDVPDADDLELYGPAEVPHVPLVLPPDLTPDPARRAAAGLREPVRPIGGGPRT